MSSEQPYEARVQPSRSPHPEAEQPDARWRRLFDAAHAVTTCGANDEPVFFRVPVRAMEERALAIDGIRDPEGATT